MITVLRSISETKFHRLIFKDAFFESKVGDQIRIEYTPEDMLSFDDLYDEIDLCSLNKANIEVKDDAIIVTKIESSLIPEDDINKWSFGIITKGNKNDWVEQQIQSIRNQKIPNYEIIICGTYYDRKEPDVRYIPFSDKDDRGWITAKKNALCKEAKYENLCVLHDRVVPLPGWFEGMKKYGNTFELLSCIIKTKEGLRAGDWITYGNWMGKYPYVGLLEYNDWDQMGCLDGGLMIIKKSIWEKNKWDERLFLNQSEDAEISHRLHRNGYVARFNPFSECITLNWRHGALPLYTYDEKKLGIYPRARLQLISRIKFYIRKLIGNPT
jgi:hypothetical protein